MGSQGGCPRDPRVGPWDPWALGTLGPGDPLALGDPWPGDPWTLGTLGPWGPIGPWARILHIRVNTNTKKICKLEILAFFWGEDQESNTLERKRSMSPKYIAPVAMIILASHDRNSKTCDIVHNIDNTPHVSSNPLGTNLFCPSDLNNVRRKRSLPSMRPLSL